MYVLGTSSVYQYSLSTAFDVSTASYDSVSFSMSSQETGNSGISFSPDGTKMFAVGFFNDNVHQYSLSTGFNLSTASYDGVSFSVAAQEDGPTAIQIAPSGTKMFIIGQTTDSVHQYSLSTAFDLSTASYDNVSFSVASQETAPRGFVFSSDGGSMYVVGLNTDTIYQYTTGTSAPATLSYPSSVDWPGGTAPDAPADGETDVLSFYTKDGGVTYRGFQVGDALA
jgi:6-phosphogluconolactonase (cycloisomerase 2 family)